MYVPPHFRQSDTAEMQAFISSARLATLVTVAAGVPLVSHVPMLLDTTSGANGTLVCHVARANAQWRAIDPAAEALVIFLGADAYVSPSWYAAKSEHGKVVPTWNYIAVHAYGHVRVIEDPEVLRELVDRLTSRHEAKRTEPWSTRDAPESFVAAQLRGIVGLEIPITRLDGKWKLSQNRSAADVNGVLSGLGSSDDPRDEVAFVAMRDANVSRLSD